MRIEKLLKEYGIDSVITDNINNIKKSAVLRLEKSNKNILKKIVSRNDLVEELSLQITYNSNAIEGSTLSREDTANIIFENKTIKNKTLVEQLEAKNHDNAFRYYFCNLKIKKILSKFF